MKFWWFCSAAGSVVGGLVLLVGFGAAKSAPQEAAAAALAVALAVVPYVLARSIQMTQEIDAQAERHRETLAALKRLTAAPASPSA